MSNYTLTDLACRLDDAATALERLAVALERIHELLALSMDDERGFRVNSVETHRSYRGVSA